MSDRRYFTFYTGNFKDGCRAIVFNEKGYAWFVADDEERTLLPCSLYSLEDAIGYTKATDGRWIELEEDVALGTRQRDKPSTGFEEAW